MRKLKLISLNGLNVLSKEEQKNIFGGYWDNSGQPCGAKECDDLGLPVQCMAKEGGNEYYCYYWIE